jgi:signal transduction histidine kinase
MNSTRERATTCTVTTHRAEMRPLSFLSAPCAHESREQDVNLEVRFRRKNGTVLSGLMSARMMRLRGERYLLSFARDVSDWKRAEGERDQLKAELHQVAKMEAIGQLARGVAHDFNNLLTVILSGAEALKHDLVEGSPDREAVDEIASAGTRAHDLTRQLLAFARRQVFAPMALDWNALILGTKKLLRCVLGETSSS